MATSFASVKAFVVCIAVLSVLVAPHAMGQGAEGLAASVNGVAITRAKLQSRLDAYMRQNKINAGGVFNPGFYKRIRRRVLDVIIAQELLWQAARDRGVVATDEEVRSAIDFARDRFGSESKFLAGIRDGGFTDEAEYTEDMRRRLSVQKLIAFDIVPSVSVSDAEIHAFYINNPERFVRPEEVRVRHILVKVVKDADKVTLEAARARIDAIHAEATGDADFAELAREHSDGPSAPHGGDLGFFGRGRMVKPFEEAAFALAPGTISGPVRTVFGYHIIKVEQRRGGDRIPEGSVAPRIRAVLERQKVKETVVARVQALHAAAVVEIH